MMGVFVQVNTGGRCKSKSNPIGYMIRENGCWEWVGARNWKGYGKWTTRGKTRPAHREVYERARGAIPDGLELDHLCRNPGCVNPDHLEPVTPKENTLRGYGAPAKNARKTHCKWGHEFTPENLYKGVGRVCRQCRLQSQRRRSKLKKRAM